MILPLTYFRIAMIYGSTALSLLMILLFLNIISINELITIIGIEQQSNEAQAIRLVLSRIQEMSTNILEIISKLLNSLLSWTGVDIDLSKIKIDVNQKNLPTNVPEGAINKAQEVINK